MRMERIERDDTYMADLTVVCTDPDADERSATGQTLAEGGYEVVSCGSLAEATEALEAHSVDCVVTEYTLPDGTGLDLAGRVRDRSPDVPCILFTNESSSAIRTDRREDVVVEYLPKGMPKARESLVRLVGNSVSQCRQVGYPLPDDEDERLAKLDIEAYAGVPLRTPGGAAIGAFCLIHDEPRSFSDAELDDLERFGDEAMEQLELRRLLNERDDTGAETGEAATGSEHS
jgi:CheY-like chemotaxis protein